MVQHSDPAAGEPGTVSRRRLIVTGATLAAAGVAAGAAAAIPLSAAESAEGVPGDTPQVPVMVHLRSAKDGTFDVFHGTERVVVEDRAFAARLTDAVRA
ncbi:hypothetical protein [Actinophytocola oryzae]|uniref:Uncharacterized protein n=1 Tax=Actinophytocola oryzae TaxID=502181 RepID=A0A4R7VFB4_9PSEU|nr:hypothetical protein [Actinophytocola oryzae]TDV47902.1 hypothetical protein CLV71_109137 [Actinophytocola oryzae]